MTQKLKQKVVLGTGRLNWERAERITDRYGTVFLMDEPNRQRLVFPVAQVPVGALARLVVTPLGLNEVVVEPNPPTIGQTYVLGEGTVFLETSHFVAGHQMVGVRPVDGRDHNWLDSSLLWRCHLSTVSAVRLELQSVR